MEQLEFTRSDNTTDSSGWTPPLATGTGESQKVDTIASKPTAYQGPIRRGATVTLVPTGDLESRAPWRGIVVTALAQGLVLKKIPHQMAPRPGVGESIRLIVTSELLPIEATAEVIGSTKEGIAVELRSSFERSTPQATSLNLEVCLPLRYRRLSHEEVPRIRQAIRGWMREPDRPVRHQGPSSSRSGGPEDLELVQRRVDRLDALLEQLTDFVVWPGIREKPLQERVLILSNEGLTFEVSSPNIAAGDVLEVELVLPFEPRQFRVRATVIIERRAPDRSKDDVVAHFDVVDMAGREMLQRYLFQVQQTHRTTRNQASNNDDTGPEATPSTRVSAPPRLAAEVPQLAIPILREPNAPTTHTRQFDAHHGHDEGSQWQPRFSPEKKERDTDDALAEVFESMQTLYGLESLDKCIAFAVDLAMRTISCECAVGFQSYDNEYPRGALVSVTRGPRLSRIKSRRFSIKGSLLEVALREGSPVASSEVDRERQLDADVDCLLGADTRSYLCAPFAYEGRTYGALVLLNRRAKGHWSQGEISIVSYIAGCLGEHIAESLPLPPSLSDLDNFESTPTIPHDVSRSTGASRESLPR